MDKVIEKWDEILQTVKRDYNISDAFTPKIPNSKQTA